MLECKKKNVFFYLTQIFSKFAIKKYKLKHLIYKFWFLNKKLFYLYFLKPLKFIKIIVFFLFKKKIILDFFFKIDFLISKKNKKNKNKSIYE